MIDAVRKGTSVDGVPGAAGQVLKLASGVCEVVTTSPPVELKKLCSSSRRKRKSPNGASPRKCRQTANGGVEKGGWGLKMTAGHSLFTGPSGGTGQALVLALYYIFQISSEEHFVYIQRV